MLVGGARDRLATAGPSRSSAAIATRTEMDADGICPNLEQILTRLTQRALKPKPFVSKQQSSKERSRLFPF